MKTFTKYTIIFLAILSLSNCTENFKDINTDPNGITNESLKQHFNHIGFKFKPMFFNVFNVTPAWNYQLQQGLMADVFSGYMTSPTPFAGNINNQTYSLVSGWNEYPWSDGYSQVMANASLIKGNVNELVEEVGDSGSNKFIHLANIIKVAAMHRVSDIYGPIRYTKFEDEATTGIYDSQEDVYKAFFNDLKVAIDELESFIGETQFKSFDKSSLEGDIASWRTFANSLRLRLAIRVSKVDPELAKTQGELALASNVGLLETKNMVINTDNFPHPISVISNSWGDIRMGAEMESILTGYKDGRIEQYFNKSVAYDKLPGTYKGVRMGVEIAAKSQYGSHSGIGKVIDKNEIVWMTSAEVLFLKAEAALRGWAGAGSAKDNYEAGIAASFSQHGISDVGTYLTDNTSVPAPFIDGLNGKEGIELKAENDINYASTVKIAYNDAGTNEEQLEQIITQKWIAMFPDGQEAWSEFRRTGYPRIFPVVVNNSEGIIDTNIQIRRIPFVDNEINTNKAEVDKAIILLGGLDNGGTRLWWDTGGSNF